MDEVLLIGHHSEELEQGRHRYGTLPMPGWGLGVKLLFSSAYKLYLLVRGDIIDSGFP